MDKNKLALLKVAAKKLVDFMKENCPPYDTVIITSEHIKIVRDEVSIPVNE